MCFSDYYQESKELIWKSKMRVKFKHAEIGNFFQSMPRLQNPYTGDAFLRRMLKRILPAEV